MDQLSLVQLLAVYALPVVLAITLHEAAHAYVAKHFGDTTAYSLGRVSLNPVRHIDPIGTLVVPLVILAASKLAAGSGFLFGWAKPVPVNFHALRKPKAHMLWVAAAGPAINIVQAIAWAIVFRIATEISLGDYSTPLRYIAFAGITVNLMLAIINLLPILPLDGGRITFSLLPDRLARPYAALERFGLPILLGLIFLEAQLGFLEPLYKTALAWLAALVGL
jgi:Zn-dependent protease